MMIYLLLFLEFCKISLFGFGGGLASLPFVFDLADKYHWFTSTQLMDMIAVAQSVPGPIAINLATYAGFEAAGIAGAAVAALGMITPPTIISIFIAKALAFWRQNKYVAAAFEGLRPAAAGLLSAVAISLLAVALAGTADLLSIEAININALIFFVVLTPAVFYFKKHIFIFIIISAAVGIIFQF
jgi:chromate transporter